MGQPMHAFHFTEQLSLAVRLTIQKPKTEQAAFYGTAHSDQSESSANVDVTAKHLKHTLKHF
jgi:hypothetical protein